MFCGGLCPQNRSSGAILAKHAKQRSCAAGGQDMPGAKARGRADRKLSPSDRRFDRQALGSGFARPTGRRLTSFIEKHQNCWPPEYGMASGFEPGSNFVFQVKYTNQYPVPFGVSGWECMTFDRKVASQQ